EALHVCGQRPDIVQAREVRQLAHLLEAELNLAVGDDAADEHAGRRLLELALHLVGDAHLLEQADDVVAAWSGRITDGFRPQTRLLQRRAGADCGFRRPRLDGDADAGLREVDFAAGGDPTALHVLLN